MATKVGSPPTVRRTSPGGSELGVDLMAQRLDVGLHVDSLCIGLGDPRGSRRCGVTDIVEAETRSRRAPPGRKWGQPWDGCGVAARGMWPSPASSPEVGSSPTPACAWQIGLGPGVQVGEVVIGAGGAVQRFLVGRELDQVAGHEPRRDAAMPKESAPAAKPSRGRSRVRAPESPSVSGHRVPCG